MSESFRDVARAALDAVRTIPGVDYADVRVAEEDREVLALRNRDVGTADRASSAGVGVRVLRRGGWGFAAAADATAASATAAARRASDLAAAAAAAQHEPIRLAEEEPQVGRYETPIELDPFEVARDRKVDDLRAAVEVLHAGADPRIQAASGLMQWRRTRKQFLSTEGADQEQTLVWGGAGVKVVAADDDGEVQRSWPMSFEGGLYAAGYETVAELALPEHAAEIREDVLALLSAPLCPAGTTTLVLDTPQLALHIHETCGHPAESDRAMGGEVPLAGASFLTPDRLGRFTYGSPRVNLTADARSPRGLGTFGWDDEGVPARTTPLVARGVFVGYLSSRETAEALGLGRSAGCMRAESWNRPPLIRMINVSLEPDPDGPASLDELIADTDRGILMTQNTSWSIDDRRLAFQFGCEAAWAIENGKRGTLYRYPVYTGSTPAFWRGCDAVGSQAAWRLWGLASCGKGDPMQLVPVGHGCAPARFRGVNVGSSG